MKVNISGKGVIPIINRVAPVYNIEVADDIVKKIIKNPKFRVYAAGGLVTAATFNPPTPAPVVEEKPVEAPKPKKEKKAPKKVEEVPGVVQEIVVEPQEATSFWPASWTIIIPSFHCFSLVWAP